MSAPQREPASPPRRRWPTALGAVATFALLALYAGLAYGTARDKSAHFDETAHVGSGFLALRERDFRAATSNGYLAQQLAALPLQTGGVRFGPPAERVGRLEPDALRDPNAIGTLLLYDSGNRPQEVLLRARLPMLALGLVLGFLVFAWSFRLSGPAGGLVSLAFFSTCPTMLAASSMVAADLAAALLLFATTWSFWALLHRASPARAALFGLCAGLFLTAKLSAVAFGPIGATLLAVRLLAGPPLEFSWWGRPISTARGWPGALAILGLALLASTVALVATVWAVFGFRFSAAPPESLAALDAAYALPQVLTAGGPGVVAPLLRAAHAGRWLPQAFLADYAGLTALAGKRLAFFLGETSVLGWRSYFLVTFLAKSSWALVAGLVVAGVLSIGRLRGPDPGSPLVRRLYPLTPLLGTLAVFLLVATNLRLNIGHRHLLPVYPFLYVLLGSLALPVPALGRPLLPGVLAALLCLGTVFDAVRTAPNPLTYLSPLLGDPERAHELFVDSTLEWGEELPAVRRWLQGHPQEASGSVYFSYFGSGVPEAYGLHLRRLPGYFDFSRGLRERLEPGTYLISGTMLEPLYYQRKKEWFLGPWNALFEQRYQWLRRAAEPLLDPVGQAQAGRAESSEAADLLDGFDLARFARLAAHLRERRADEVIAGSVWVFRLGAEELREALDGPPAELLPEPRVTGMDRRPLPP